MCRDHGLDQAQAEDKVAKVIKGQELCPCQSTESTIKITRG